MKPTKSKPSQSTPIRKGKVSDEEITRVAEELTKSQTVDEMTWCKNWQWPHIVEAPKIEPVEAWDYEIYSAYVKAHCKMHDTYETTGDELKKMFPQNKDISDIVRNLKRSHNLSWRRVENGRNDTYVFFVEPTREELIVMLTSAETRVTDLQHLIDVQRQVVRELMEENTQLKSDLFYSKRSNIITFAFAIWAVITIIFKSVAL